MNQPTKAEQDNGSLLTSHVIQCLGIGNPLGSWDELPPSLQEEYVLIARRFLDEAEQLEEPYWTGSPPSKTEQDNGRLLYSLVVQYLGIGNPLGLVRRQVLDRRTSGWPWDKLSLGLQEEYIRIARRFLDEAKQPEGPG